MNAQHELLIARTPYIHMLTGLPPLIPTIMLDEVGALSGASSSDCISEMPENLH